jgi:hypothetical protein
MPNVSYPDYNVAEDDVYWGKITKKDHKMVHEGWERFWLKRGGRPVSDFDFNVKSWTKGRLVVDIKNIRSD